MRHFFFILLLLVVGCSSKKSTPEASTQNVQPEQPAVVATTSPALATGVFSEFLFLEEYPRRILIQLKNPAFVTAETGVHSPKGKKALGGISVESSDPKNCGAEIVKTEGEVIIRSLREDGACRLTIGLNFKTALPVVLEASKLGLDFKKWPETVRVTTKEGEILATQVQSLAVKCGDCALAGREISRRLDFDLGHGNVGFEALNASVKGKTKGDIILKWTSTRGVSEVDVHSAFGDVNLFFPVSNISLGNLSAPRGDVYSKFKHHHGGIAVGAVADVGNVRIYPSQTLADTLNAESQ